MKRHTPEQIVAKLRQADLELGKGLSVKEVCRKIEVTEQTYYRWRQKYACLAQDGIRFGHAPLPFPCRLVTTTATLDSGWLCGCQHYKQLFDPFLRREHPPPEEDVAELHAPSLASNGDAMAAPSPNGRGAGVAGQGRGCFLHGQIRKHSPHFSRRLGGEARAGDHLGSVT
jgi:hypothetical protein